METKSKPKKAVSLNKNNKKGGRKKPHVCGAINGVMGKGAFTKYGDKWKCVDCGKVWPQLPDGYLEAKKKLNPKEAALLEKGTKHKTTGAEYEKWRLAGVKAAETRRKNEELRKKNRKK